jgi:hypothetical protein
MPREGDSVLSCALEIGHRQANLHRDPSCEEWISGEAFAGFDAFAPSTASAEPMRKRAAGADRGLPPFGQRRAGHHRPDHATAALRSILICGASGLCR